MTEEVTENTEVSEVEDVSGPSQDQIELAKKYGWRSQDQFDNPPENWVDADRFLEFPSTQSRILRDQNAELSKKLEQIENDFTSRFENLDRTYQSAMERQKKADQERFEAELEAARNAQREAVNTMDQDAFEAAKKREDELRRKQAEVAPEVDQTVEEYRKKNEWTQDPLLWKFAADAVQSNPEILETADARRQLEYAEQKVRELFPHKFQKAEPPTPKVDPGGLGGGHNPGLGFNDLPPEAKEAAKAFVKRGIYKDTAEYVRDYYSQEKAS